jgi:hypothetical protein
MIGNMPEVGFGYYGMLGLDNAGGGVGWGVLLVVWSPLHGVVDLPGWYLW